MHAEQLRTFASLATSWVEQSLKTMGEQRRRALEERHIIEGCSLSELAAELVQHETLEVGDGLSLEERCSEAFLGDVMDCLAALHLLGRHPHWQIEVQDAVEPQKDA